MDPEKNNRFFKRYLNASFKLASNKPAYLQGLRVAIIVGLPVVFGLFTNTLPESFLFMLAALNVTLVDMGGMTYRKTARVLLTATILNACAAVVAQWVSFHILVACIVTIIWISSVAFLGLLGNSGVMMAFVNSVIFVIVVANPDSKATTINTFLLFIGGGIWAVLPSVFAWPIRPYKPIRKAIASCFLDNATFIREVSKLYHVDNPAVSINQKQTSIDKAHLSFREKIDKAYEMISNERKGRFCKTDVEDSLISLLHSISKDHRSIISLMDWFGEKTDSLKSHKVEHYFNELADIHCEIAEIIIHPKKPEHDIIEKVELLKREYHTEEKQIISEEFKEISSTLLQLLERIKHEAQWATKQHPAFSHSKENSHHETLLRDSNASFLSLLRNNLNFKSSGFRHAIRIGITSSIAVMIAHLVNLPHGYWLPLTVVVIMAPDFGGSFLIRTLQRGTGTILGGLLALLIISEIHSPWLIVVFLIIITFLSISMLTINYAAFVFFLTPLIVTMYAISDIGDWHIPLDRAIDTLSGMGLALIGSQLLFPDWERNHFPVKLSAMLKAINTYFQSLLLVMSGKEVPPTQLVSHGRSMELSASNANASLQRTLTQPGFSADLIAPMMSFLTSTHMLMQSLTRLHEYVLINDEKIENLDKFLEAGQNISNLLKLMSENIQLQKSKEVISDEIIIDSLNKMNEISEQTLTVLSTISKNNLPAIEFNHLSEAEHSMLKTLAIYLSKCNNIRLQDVLIFEE